MLEYILILSVAKQALLEEIHWQGTFASKDYITACFPQITAAAFSLNICRLH